MNRELNPELQRDLFASSAARLRRRLRLRRQAAFSLATFLLLLSVAFLAMRAERPPQVVSPARPPAPASSATTSAPIRERALEIQRLTTDEELLAALAEQGPMLITHPDGRKQLILTRPH
jgi:hypothetical protein